MVFEVVRILGSRVRGLLRRQQIDEDFEQELEAHLTLLVEENLGRGMTPEEARRAARLRLGSITQLRETHRELRGLPWVESFAQDIRYSLRSLRKDPGFTLVALLTLALGIGANTAIFTVINAVLLRPLPYAHPEELVTWRSNESLLDVDDIRAQSDRFFSAGGAVNSVAMDYAGGTEPVGVKAGYVDAGLFQVLGVPALLGRTLSAEEDRDGGPRVVVLAYPFWQQYLSGDESVLGTTIPLSGNRYTVIGVMPASFSVPQARADVFVSLRVAYPQAAAYRGVHFMRSFWRLKAGVTPVQASAAMATIDARLAADYPDEEKGRHRLPVPLQQYVTGDVRTALWILFGAVCVVLLIACANFASLLMARAVTRRSEMVIRAALGGGRRRLIRRALTESSLLALGGGAAGLILAQWGIRSLVAAKPAALAGLNEISLDTTVLVFGLVLATLTGLIFGLAPAWTASRANVADVLKEEGRASTSGPAEHGFRNVLVTAEIALAFMLLVGAGLLIRSFERLRSIDIGFDPKGVISIDINLPDTRYAEIPKQTAFRRELLGRLNALPGVQAAMVGDVPLNGGELTHNITFEGRPPVPEGEEPEVDTFCIMGDYFRVMHIPLRAGRTLTDMDREGQPPVAVINEALARQFFAGQDPIGQRIRWARQQVGPLGWMTIVGVVGDLKQYSLAEPPYPAVFTPFPQSNEDWRRWMSVVVRTAGDSATPVPAIKRQIWSLDSQIPLNRIESMEDLLGLSLAERRFNMLLLGLFAGMAVILAAVGIYGLVSYSVSRRTHEIGIRMAVGARRTDVLRLVMGQGARLAAVGVAAGIVGALALTRLMASLLFSITPGDPVTFAAVIVLMIAVVLLACYMPALRAMRVDPIVAVRSE